MNSFFTKFDKRNKVVRNQRPFPKIIHTSGTVVNFSGGSLSDQNLGFLSSRYPEQVGEEDLYLHISFLDGSCEIESLLIKNEAEVTEAKQDNDLLFDIYLPIFKVGQFTNYYFGLPNLIPAQSLDNGTSYKKGGKIKTTPFLVKTDNTPKQIISKKDLNVGECILLEFNAGTIENLTVNISRVELRVGASSSAVLASGEENDDGEIEGCSFSLPMAFLNDDGEVVNCHRGNVNIRVQEDPTFQEELASETYILNYFLIPNFEEGLGGISNTKPLKQYYPL